MQVALFSSRLCAQQRNFSTHVAHRAGGRNCCYRSSVACTAPQAPRDTLAARGPPVVPHMCSTCWLRQHPRTACRSAGPTVHRVPHPRRTSCSHTATAQTGGVTAQAQADRPSPAATALGPRTCPVVPDAQAGGTRALQSGAALDRGARDQTAKGGTSWPVGRPAAHYYCRRRPDQPVLVDTAGLRR